MKRTVYPVLMALIFLFATIGCESPSGGGETSLDSQIDSVSYSLGYLYGQNLSSGGVESLEDDKFLSGLNQALDRGDSQIDDMAMQSLMQRYQQEITQAAQARREGEAAANIEEGNRFLEENAQNEDVSVTESGLQYRVIEEGSGDRPEVSDEVEVHYRGTLVSGEEFDSSHSRNQTATFPVSGVIAGWTEGLQLMREGATYEFFIPSELAYGNNPPPGSIIEPGSVLIFEVELIDIKE
ncbi:FKBP-type peptidyl-prolyl cis-trans isomerase [Rhodohalobacter sp. SW132]|uniref:FKBP-type peptidyl-prolyl cis-trans isomerase n=1 Tax=Rhodohalobacter sp. SW132 TaxID=2293433 RepID=UPI000E23BFD1|nr:FKBP-type peptidyl-prolyl cis-trans isomerase [Rhodohalobacter sp. SW132]REL37639.1 FKBP-type peptidyl-prolyl cis-trans isomerase [Rhodohalobacter sp. SW132]